MLLGVEFEGGFWFGVYFVFGVVYGGEVVVG